MSSRAWNIAFAFLYSKYSNGSNMIHSLIQGQMQYVPDWSPGSKNFFPLMTQSAQKPKSTISQGILAQMRWNF